MPPLRFLPMAAIVAALLLPASAVGAAPMAPAAPHASIAAVDCGAGGAVVTLRNPSSVPARFTLLRGARAHASTVVGAGEVATTVVPVREGRPEQVTVRSSGGSTSALLQADCDPRSTAAGRGAPAATPESTPVGTVAAPRIGHGTRVAEVPAGTQPANGSVRSADDRSAQLWLALAAAALLVAALLAADPARRRIARVASSRRRRQHTDA